MTDAERVRELAAGFRVASGQIIEVDVKDAARTSALLIRIADIFDAVPPEILKALADGMKTAVSTALLRQIAEQKLSIEVDEETRAAADFQEGYDCVVKLVRAMIAAAPEKPE